MKPKIIAGSIIASVILIGLIVGYIVHTIQRQNRISEIQTLFEQGKYQEIIGKLDSKLGSNTVAADERIWLARSYYRLRDYDRSLEVLDPLLRTGQEDARAVALSGWIWVKKNSPLQAQVRFEKAAKLGLEAESEGGLGAISLLRSENYRSVFLNEAESHLKKSISLDPNNPQVYLVLSELRRLQHQYKEAIEMANKAIQLAPHWSEPYGMLGWIHLLQGNHVEAEKSFTESQKHGGSKEEIQYYLALSVYYQGRLNEALSFLDDLIQSGKEKVRDALIDAGKIAIIVNPDKSIDYFNRAWSIKPDPLVGMQLIELLIRRGKTEEAIKILSQVMADWPFLALAHLEMGNFLLKQNDIQRAYSAYQNVLDQDGRNFLANYNLGCILPLRGDFQQSPDYFETVVREYEDYFPAQVNMLLAQLSVDRVMDADNQLDDLLSKYPDNPYLFLARALERFAAADTRAALEYLDRSQEAANDRAVSFVIRGEIQLRLFQFEKALASFEEALLRDEKNIRALLGKAHASYRLGNYNNAEQIYQELLGSLSSFSADQQAEIQNGLAMTALERGDSAKSVEIWNQMKRSNSELIRQYSVVNSGLIDENNPNSVVIDDLKVVGLSRQAMPESYYNMALFLSMLGRISESMETYETLVKRYPGYLPGLFNLANTYSQNGRIGDAIALYDRAQRAAPQRAEILNNQAAVYSTLDQVEKAKIRLEEADAIDSNFNEIRFNKILLSLRENRIEDAKKYLSTLRSSSITSALVKIAEGLVKMSEEDWPESEKSFQAARELDPQNVYACLNHGVVLAKQKRYSEALEAMKEAVANNPSLAAAHRVLGLLYCELGLYVLAVPSLETAIQLDPSQSDLTDIVSQIRKWVSETNPSNP